MLVAAVSLPQIGIACERARLPRLADSPFALAETETLLSAVSDEAASFGIQAGMAVSAARTLCQGLTVLPYDRAAYEEAAESVWDLLAVESSVVEPVSPELAYLEVAGQGAVERVRGLAQALATHAHTPVFVGIARSKIAARHAPHPPRRPEDGLTASVMVVPAGQEASALASVPPAVLPQISDRIKAQLERRGLKTLGDILEIPEGEMKRQFKETGTLLRKLAVGEDADPVRPLWPPARIEQFWTFEEEVGDLGLVHNALQVCAERIAVTLLTRCEYCRFLSLTLGLADGSALHECEALSLPERNADALTRAAQRLLRRIPAPETPILQLRLCAAKIGAGASVQLALLDDNGSIHGLPHERRQKQDSAVAHLREKYGVGAVVSGSLLHQAKQLHLWTYPLTHEHRESVRVVTDTDGQPTRYYRDRSGAGVQEYHISHIQNRWRETEWNWGHVLEKTCFRVVAGPEEGLYELHQVGQEWKLTAAAD